MSEPIYIAQTAEPRSSTEAREWWRARVTDASKEGCTFFRYSVHPQQRNLFLIEGWQSRPKDQGEVRWQLTADPTHD